MNKFQIILNNFFNKFHSFDGIMHWITQRFSAIMILVFIPTSFLLDNIYFFLLVFVFIIFHISVGLKTLIDDYIHDDLFFLICSTLLRITVLFSLKSIFIIFIC